MKFKNIPLNSLENKIHWRALSAASAFQSGQAGLLHAIMEVDRARLFEKLGCRSAFVYCVKHLRLSEDLACSFISVARKAREVAELARAVQDGLSISKAKKLVPFLTEENQDEWIAKAQGFSYRELEREIARVFPQAAHPERSTAISGTLTKLEITLDQETLSALRYAQDLFSSKLGAAPSLAETIRAMAEEYVEKHNPVRRAERAHKPAVLTLVKARDEGKCQTFDGEGKQCGERRWVHVHHLQPKSEGGADTLDNLITLCSFHHRLFHRFEDNVLYPSRDG